LLILCIQVKVCTLEGALPRVSYEQMLERPLLRFSGRNMSKFPDLMVEAAVVDENGLPVHVPAFTAYKHFSKRWEWNQWISLPVKYSDLGRNSWLRRVRGFVQGFPVHRLHPPHVRTSKAHASCTPW
jgi:phosphatidylinositol 3-kinase